jgi:predicted RNA methylase
MQYSATYSPDDNKLRLYSVTRLPDDVYRRVAAMGFTWAPKQHLFVAPSWTPQREDLLIELCGEIDDEDTSLLDRAEQRADRFEDYSERREADAARAQANVAAVADNIPLGQPILVGHHSEKRARKDAERIDAGMRKAVRLWETANYWTSRAAGAVAAAKYRERADVRARRIKKLEADLRRVERDRDLHLRMLAAWDCPLTIEQAIALTASSPLGRVACVKREDGFYWYAWDVLRPDGERYSTCPAMTVEDVKTIVRCNVPRHVAHVNRWIAHYANRIAYERAMLDETGYVEPPKRTSKAALPLLNYSGLISYANPYRDEVVTVEAKPMKKAEWLALHADYKGTRLSADKTHRVRIAMMAHSLVPVFLVDVKEHCRPGQDPAIDARIEAGRAALAANASAIAQARRQNRALLQRDERPAPPAESEQLQALRDRLAAGVRVVRAPQLFPTPAPIAARMVALACVEHGHRVLEPSAGTGALLRAIADQAARLDGGGVPPTVTAIEVNRELAIALPRELAGRIACADFLACASDRLVSDLRGDATPLGLFESIIMNPPFGGAADVAHIKHALSLLAPGGRLVALCANGPRQHRELRSLVDERGGLWEVLPAGSFADAGTNVNVALLVVG